MKSKGSFARGRAAPGQATMEYMIASAAVILPVTFALVFTAQLLWVWHSVAHFTRDGAYWAAAHCWQGGDNVVDYMKQHVPVNIDQDQFINGDAEIAVQYFKRDAGSGALTEFACDAGECTTDCVPDVVTVTVRNYEFRKFMNYLGLPSVALPDFHTSIPMESAGCFTDADNGSTCQ